MTAFAAKSSALVTLLALATLIAGADEVPPRSAGGQALAVPEAQLDLGNVYHVQPGIGTQFTWDSDADLLRLVPTCNRVVGYFVAPFELEEELAEGKPPLLAGAFRVPVASLRAGDERLDARFLGPGGLNAAEYPEITFQLTRVGEVRPLSEENGRQSYELKLAGTLTIKEQTTTVEMPARLTFVPFSFQMMQFSPGDLLILRAGFDAKTTDLGLPPPNDVSADIAGETVRLELYLLCSTVSPEKNLDPAIKHEHYQKQLRFLTLLRDFNDAEKGYAFGRAFMKEAWDDGPALNRLAWATLTEKGIEARDLRFVTQLAARANELTEFKDPECLHTLAKLHFEKGELSVALKWARRAAEHLSGLPAYVAAPIQATREHYESLDAQRGE